MSTAATIASQLAPIRKYELGRPIIRREQRLAFEQIHRAVAQTWSDSMAEYLPDDAGLEFEGLDFGTFSSVPIDESCCAQVALFSIASSPINGVLMMSGELAKFLVRSRLGLKPTGADGSSTPFTRIEAAIARETVRAMLIRLGEAYAAAGIGAVGNVRECDDLADSFVFAPEELLALLKFHLSGSGEDLPLLIALSAAVVGTMAEHHPAEIAEANGRNAIVNVVRRLPIEVDVVLGSWKVPVGELLRLRAGDRIVLPDGEDAWLAARGVRIRRASIELRPTGAKVEVRGRARTR